jgi:hypothetical protein
MSVLGQTPQNLTISHVSALPPLAAMEADIAIGRKVPKADIIIWLSSPGVLARRGRLVDVDRVLGGVYPFSRGDVDG